MPVQEDYREATGAEGFRAAASVATVDEPSGIAAESIRSLRSQLVTVQAQEGHGMFAICGPSDGVGTTFVAVNLAVALSQIGLNTLLIDADLRDPEVHDMILPPQAPRGLQELLESGAAADEAIHREVMPHLSILYAGAANPNAQELLATGEFKDLVEIWSREYDFVIVDTPPASASSDGRFLGAVLGASIVVARKDVTSIADLRTLVKELQQSGSSVAGVVLNEI